LAGAETIIICGRRMDPLLETKSAIIKDCHDCAVQTITVDVTEEASVQSLFEEILELPDVLINNAGLATFQTVVDSDTESWWKDYVFFTSSISQLQFRMLITSNRRPTSRASIFAPKPTFVHWTESQVESSMCLQTAPSVRQRL
jgi:NAD(P)-dependent dehydrogenase (short-subunit alcohol dehydrogenase family)